MALEAVEKIISAEKEAEKIRRLADVAAKARIAEAEKKAAEVFASVRATALSEAKNSSAKNVDQIAQRKKAAKENSLVKIKEIRNSSKKNFNVASDYIVKYVISKGN
ncbi:hypothetical protein SDC9_111347 [bioreactor metagenome]|uniref:Uncharacterized protein n=1 Tax=bioreactor metagenome TaxID=1076179 RepID=A0A645BIR9_9ZZZZ|nr:hypothetical protein [Oscillospiraceae bacterium]